MTVRELVSALSAIPDDATVLLECIREAPQNHIMSVHLSGSHCVILRDYLLSRAKHTVRLFADQVYEVSYD